MDNTTQRKAEDKSLLLVPVFALCMALSYALFIFPNNFAPSGVGGIATMVQYVFKFNAGYLNLLININLGQEDFANYPQADLSEDNKVDIADLNEVINTMLGKTHHHCDVNDDGTVDIVDINQIINALLGWTD